MWKHSRPATAGSSWKCEYSKGAYTSTHAMVICAHPQVCSLWVDVFKCISYVKFISGCCQHILSLFCVCAPLQVCAVCGGVPEDGPARQGRAAGKGEAQLGNGKPNATDKK